MREDRSLDRATRRANQTRQRLKNASLTLFVESGIDNTAIEEITERADVGKGTFYRYFDSKEGIAAALLEDAVNHLLDKISTTEHECEDLNEAIEHLIRAHSIFLREREEEFLLMFQGRVLLQLQRETLEELEMPYLRYLEGIENQLARFLPARIESVRLRRFACALAGFVSGFFSFATIGMSPEELEMSMKPLRRAFVATSTVFLGG